MKKQKTKKITEMERLEGGLDLVYEISCCAQSPNPERDWKSAHDGICKIYRILHTIKSPGCRKNHPDWTEELDAMIERHTIWPVKKPVQNKAPQR